MTEPNKPWIIERNPIDSQTRIISSGKGGSVYPWGTISYWRTIVQQAQDNEPAKAGVMSNAGYTLEIGDRTVKLEGDLSVTSDRENFYYSFTRRASENGKLVKEKTWKETIPRDHQ